MCSPIAFGVTSALLAGAGGFYQAEQGRQQQQYQASMMEYQAQVNEANAAEMANQAKLEGQKTQIEQQRVDEERNKLRKAYEANAGRNRATIAGLGVDMASGSALDSLMGDAQAFGQDMGTNRFNFAMAAWEGKERERQIRFQEEQFKAQAQADRASSSWLKKTSGNLGNSLLTGFLSGASAGLGSYAGAGGFATKSSFSGNSISKSKTLALGKP